jgi:tubulin beta
MGTELREMLYNEHGIVGDSEYCGDDNDAQLGRINVFFYEDSGSKYVPRAVFFDPEPGVIDAVRASPLGKVFRPKNLVNHTRGQKWAKGHYRRVDTSSSDPPLQKRQAPILLTLPVV